MRLKRVIAALLCLAYTGTQVVFCHAAEVNYWDERRQAVRDRQNEGLRMASASLPAFSASPDFLPLTARASALAPLAPARPDLASLPGLENALLPYGVIRGTRLSKNLDAPWVVHIQDVHGVEEA
jgi:hypothetical protein